MGILSDVGAPDIESALDMSGSGSTILLILLIIVVLIISGIGAFLYYSKKV